MSTIQYREITQADIPFISKLRASSTEEDGYWNNRISGYFLLEHHPQKALLPRIMYVAASENKIIGFIAGHLTERFGCDGELQWIDVIPEYRKTGVAFKLLLKLAEWFVDHKAFYICVDVGSEAGRKFYTKNGATNLNQHWMIWKDISELIKNR